ncbi:hypothetical protein SLE2022_051360 [Rubroshorea leprosula]
MVSGSTVHGVASPHSHRHGGESPGNSSLDPPSRGKSRSKRVMSDRESRIDRRRHNARRGVKPYQAPTIDKLCVPAPLEGCPITGENGTHSSDIKSSIVAKDAHREGLPSSFLTISFPPCQVPVMDIPVLTVGVQPVESPDSIGAIK